MPWFKVDDQFHGHPKVRQLDMASRGLWVTAGSWCANYNTNGVVPENMVRYLGGTPRQVNALLEAKLWEPHLEGYKFVHWRKSQDGDYRRNIRKSVRQAVYDRDGHACFQCGATENLSLDHIIRYADDGPDTIENLRVLCMPCNLKRELNRR